MAALYGIIGYPLSHSFSPAYFTHKFAQAHTDARYEAFPLASVGDFRDLLSRHPDIAGLNVTLPYKQAIIPYLDALDAAAEEIGAVNCIALQNGVSTGFNTDAAGFRMSLQPLLQPHHTQALVLGTGGASRAAAYVLRQLNIRFKHVSRSKTTDTLAYTELNAGIMAAHTLIINTTPVGMFPHTGEAPPIPYEHLTPRHLLYDLIYNPEQTLFLASGRAKGAAIKNGLGMLHLQAEESWAIWQRSAKND